MFPSPDYRLFDLAGPHQSIGLALGKATEPFTVPAWWPPAPDAAFAQACERQIASIYPPIVQELQGYAEGQGIDYEFLLRGICRRSMKVRAGPPPEAPTYPEGGCSSVAVQDADGHVLVGRNYDFHTMQRIRQRIRLRPGVGLASLGTRGSVPGGRYDGVNAAGLFICLHVVLCDVPDAPHPGIPFHLVPRIVLETCRSAQEARALLTRLPHLHAFNYLVADATGEMFVAEAHPSGVRIVEPESVAGRPAIAAANHFRHPDLRPLQGRRKLDHSEARVASLLARAADLTYETLPAALADHGGNVCGHRGGHTTLWSLRADLTARQIAYAAGAPCGVPYEMAAWPN